MPSLEEGGRIYILLAYIPGYLVEGMLRQQIAIIANLMPWEQKVEREKTKEREEELEDLKDLHKKSKPSSVFQLVLRTHTHMDR